MQTPIASLINNEFEASLPDSFRVKKHEETKSPLKPNDKV